jgi:YidC/Oxa1 family membrane protein insertase
MPVLFALYGVLGTRNPALMINYLSQHHEIGTFYQIIPNVALTPQMVWNSHNYVMLIPYVLLVLLFAVSVWLPQALMPGDKQQKMIGGYMAIVMLWFGWISPAGVLLYWDVSSIWGVAQQQITMTMTKRELEANEPAPTTGKKKGTSSVAKEAVAEKKPSNKKSTKS